jgi:hypothetical protein
MSDAQPFALFVDGKIAILATDPALLNDILAKRSATALPSSPATRIAGFHHQQERTSFARLAAAVDYDGTAAPDAPADSTPTFLNGNIRSLSDAFSGLATERLVERRDAIGTHQTVTYTWQPEQ